MKTLYWECNMGAAGDMLLASLLELHPDPQDFLKRLNGAGIPGVRVTAAPSVKCGITGTHVTVQIDGREEHSHDVGTSHHDHDHTHEHHHDHTHGGHDHDDHHHTHDGHHHHHDEPSHDDDHHDHNHTHDNHAHGDDHHDHNHTHDNHAHGDHHHTHAHGDGHTHTHDGHDHHHDHNHTHDEPSHDDHHHTHDHGDGHSHSHHHTHDGDHHDHHDHTHSHDGLAPHTHSGLDDIAHLIGHLQVSGQVKENALAVYRLIAAAESHAHGVPVTEIHFHEVGTMDAVADIVGVCIALEELAPEQILASPVHVGSGQVRCAHGVLPVPAPATAHILAGVPVYGGSVRGELCTPTGAALLKHFAAGFGGLPVMTLEQTGYGMGNKDFESANCVRALWGDTSESGGEVTELICNIDDMTPEAVAFAQQLLMEEGALDVYTIPIGMKKGRTGILLTCMCRSTDKDRFISLIFRHTTTLGMRETVSRRHTLTREEHTAETPYGPVRIKTARGHGAHRSKPEYEDVAKLAREHHLSLQEILHQIPNAPSGEQ